MGDNHRPTSVIYENVYYKKQQVIEKDPPKNLLRQTQEQVDELVEILHENVGKAMEREQKLSDLNEISESLEKRAGEFKTQAVVVKRKERKKRLKTNLVFAGLFAILLIVLILFLIQTFVTA